MLSSLYYTSIHFLLPIIIVQNPIQMAGYKKPAVRTSFPASKIRSIYFAANNTLKNQWFLAPLFTQFLPSLLKIEFFRICADRQQYNRGCTITSFSHYYGFSIFMNGFLAIKVLETIGRKKVLFDERINLNFANIFEFILGIIYVKSD